MLPASCRELQAGGLCSPDAQAARSIFGEGLVHFAVCPGFRLIALLLWRDNKQWMELSPKSSLSLF